MSSSLWHESIENLYGKLLPNCEFLVDGHSHFICFHRNKEIIVVSWNTQSERWSSGIDRNELDGLSFSSPKFFEDVVFSGSIDDVFLKKSNLNECLVHGVSFKKVKKVFAEFSPNHGLEITFDSKKWNEALLGNSISFIEVVHDEYSRDGTAQPYEYEIYISKNWINIHYEDPDDSWLDFDIFEGNLKDLKGYYS